MINLMNGDCLELMKTIPDKSIDMVLCDPPYGTTQCKWDSVIPFDLMWSELERICKKTAAIALFGAEPFSSMLRCSNIKNYKYDWTWEKSHATGFLNAWKQPLRKTENISVFYKAQSLYNPLIEDKDPSKIRAERGSGRKKTDVYGSYEVGNVENETIPKNKSMPTTLLRFPGVNPAARDKLHPTQKPVALLEYLIKTYTLENETVLDFTAGSFSTGVACVNLSRSFIGIEKDLNYFNIGKNRIIERIKCLDLKIEPTIGMAD